MRALEPGDRGEPFIEYSKNAVVARQYVRDFQGKRRRIRGTGRNESAARRKLAKNVEAAFAQSSLAKRGGLFGDACDEWLQHIAALVEDGLRSPTTYDKYEYHLQANLARHVKDLYLDEVTPGRIHQVLDQVRADHGPAAAKTCRTILSGVCGFLVKRDRMERNPVREVGRADPRPRTHSRALTVDEIRQLVRIFATSEFSRRRDLSDLIRFMLATGARVGEALAVSWDEIDLHRGTVVFAYTIVRVKGKGLVRVRTKTSTSDRKLVVPDWCIELLRARAARSTAYAVFPSSRGTWQDRNNVLASMRKVLAGTELSWFVSHTARRTVATLLDQQGLTARAIADQLGHANPSMTQDVYMGRKIDNEAAAKSLSKALDDVVHNTDGV